MGPFKIIKPFISLSNFFKFYTTEHYSGMHLLRVYCHSSYSHPLLPSQRRRLMVALVPVKHRSCPFYPCMTSTVRSQTFTLSLSPPLPPALLSRSSSLHVSHSLRSVSQSSGPGPLRLRPPPQLSKAETRRRRRRSSRQCGHAIVAAAAAAVAVVVWGFGLPALQPHATVEEDKREPTRGK